MESAGPADRIAVTGAAGGVGGRVAQRLADAGVTQRLLVRDLSRAPQLPAAEVAQADYADAAAMRAALAGIDTVFLVSGREAEDRLAHHLSAVDAAVAAGVTRIVYLSFLGADPAATFTLARQHWATEQHIWTTQSRWTFLRDSLYADLLPFMAGADGVLRGPAGDGAVSAVARDDVADVAVAVLLGDGHDGMTYDVTGPRALTLAEIADELSAAANRPVRYQNETIEQAYASRAHYGAPQWEVTGWVSSYAAIGAGELAAVSDTVPRLTGHEATSFAEFLRRYPDSYQHLR
ncbi:MAG TPA: NAD(P)H-binding protein [Actinomycetes bacterium]|nr:NAD(P)H-binding protein [Actinomycetes bacterium]